MPIFEYTCKKCNNVFSVLKLSREDTQISCPSCGSYDVTKMMSVFGCKSDSGGSGMPSGMGGFSGGG